MKINLETNVASFVVPEEQRDTFTAMWQNAVNDQVDNPDAPTPTITLTVSLDHDVPLFVEEGQFFLHFTEVEFKTGE